MGIHQLPLIRTADFWQLHAALRHGTIPRDWNEVSDQPEGGFRGERVWIPKCSAFYGNTRMIQVTKTEEGTRTPVTIDGELSGDCISVVETCCTQAASIGKSVHLVLRDANCVDSAGKILLRGWPQKVPPALPAEHRRSSCRPSVRVRWRDRPLHPIPNACSRRGAVEKNIREPVRLSRADSGCAGQRGV